MNESLQPDLSSGPAEAPGTVLDSPKDGVWAGMIGVAFIVSMALAYRPNFDSLGGIGDAAVPWLALAGMVLAWSGRTFLLRLGGILVAVVAWAALVGADDRWSMLTFALYALCFIVNSNRPAVGVVLAGIVSAIWTVASLGGPSWTWVIPFFVFCAASTIALAIHRIGRLTAEQAALIGELQSTREELAVSERSRGVLEERARLAGEIHDTLAQGFTSIVLLARTGTRSTNDPRGAFTSIEAAAQENLDAARRLVGATRPGELADTALPEALRRHLGASLPDSVVGDVQVVGAPLPLPGAVESVLLRAAQEGIRNACLHAQPQRVDVTLRYGADAVTLDVHDDGTGFHDGTVHDRGSLTGGQGLETLARRVESLAGRLTITPGDERGSILTVELPVDP